ncbi:hypothetical protein SDJN02_03257, partial [Cucurbita argyrosperma subsp. argyrosperma]
MRSAPETCSMFNAPTHINTTFFFFPNSLDQHSSQERSSSSFFSASGEETGRSATSLAKELIATVW